jgi:O-antigen ligase
MAFVKDINYFKMYIIVYISILPFNFFNSQMGVLSGILLLLWFLNVNQERFNRLKMLFEMKAIFIFLFFLFYAYISSFWSYDMEQVFRELNKFKYYWIILPILITMLDNEDWIRVVYLFTISLGVYAIFSIGIFFDLIHLIHNSPDDPKGILIYAVTTPLMAIGALFGFVISIYERNFRIKVLFVFIACLCLFAMVINNGRAGQVAFILTILTISILLLKKFSWKVLVSCILGCLIIVGSLFFLGQFDRFIKGFDEVIEAKEHNYSGSWGIRTYLWVAGINSLSEQNILFGNGIGSVPSIIESFTIKHPSEEAQNFRNFHNYHMDLLVKFGIFGYMLHWIAILILLYYLRGEQFWFLLALSFFCIAFYDSFFDDLLTMKPFNNIFFVFIILFSLVLSGLKISNKSDK